MTTRVDFRAAAARLPRVVPWLHHGRDPRNGLDCVGLVLWLFREAGHSIDHLDRPYGVRDVARRNGLLPETIIRDFDPLSVPRTDWRDGDLLLIRRDHLGVVVGRHVFHADGDGVHSALLRKLLPTIRRAFRRRGQ